MFAIYELFSHLLVVFLSFPEGFGKWPENDDKNMVTAPAGWRAVITVWKKGSTWNVVKSTCF